MGLFYPRGVAISGYPFRLINKNNGDPVTSGTVTVLVSLDGGAQAAATNTPTHNGNGEWLIDITAAERDAQITSLIIDHVDSVPLHLVITTDGTLGPGAKQITLDFGTNGKYGDIWVTTQADPSTVVASGQADNTGQLILYLDNDSYYLYFTRPGYNFTNPYSLVVQNSTTVTLTVTEASSSLAVTAYASVSEAQAYFDTRLNTSAWDDANSTDKQKALVMATRAINRLDFQGEAIQSALDLGNQFPRGDDTEVPEEIIWATCEEALALLSTNSDEEYDRLRVTSESFSGARTTYASDHHPANIRSGIMSGEAWKFLLLYLRDDRSVQLHRM